MSIEKILENGLESIEKKFEAKFGEYEKQVAENGKADEATRADVKSMAKDVEQLHAELKGVNATITDLQQKGIAGDKQEQSSESIGSQFVKSDSFMNFKSGQTQKARFEVKNTIVTGGDNSVTQHDKLGGVVAGPFRALTVMPTVQQGSTNSNIVYYSRELAWTNNAAGQTEGSAKAESSLTFEEVNTPVQTIAHFLKVSKQALDDSDFLASYVDRRMRHGVNNKVENQIINGDGTGNNLSGWITNGTATDPTGTGDIVGLIRKMMLEITLADYQADYIYLNPTDWSTIENARRTGGGFEFDSNVFNYLANGAVPTVFGLPVVASNNVPAGTVIVKSMMADMYAQRMGTVVEMFEQDDTNVQSNLVTVRAETRGAELVMTPAAIRTGLIASIT